jgi:uncharacterized protein YpuA (DUF1002 family)
MLEELARVMLHFASGLAAAAGVMFATRLIHRIWPDPAALDAQIKIAALKAELVAVREDSRELDRKIGTTRERAALAMGKHKDAFGSWKAGKN